MSSPISLEGARTAVLERTTALPAEAVALDGALGRRLAADAIAAGPIQPFDNSAMDGFAVRAADLARAEASAPVALALVDESRAGHPAARELGAGEAIAISTGAVMPAGADAVVRVEDTSREGDRVSIGVAVAADANVRHAGEDLAAGAVAVAAGALIGPAELGALATIGADPVSVFRRPRVSVLASGDELRAVGEPLAPGTIRDSNGPTVAALARLAGADVIAVDRTRDEPDEVEAKLAHGLDGADVALVCGGVSVGEHDHVKATLARLGVEEVFWRVALKPGGPTWFGTRGETLVFGLPGNPVSAFVVFTLLARPALALLGGGEPGARRVRARLGADYPKSGRRAHAARARLELTDSGWVAWPVARQGSHVLTSLLEADCLALVPAESDGLAAGAQIEVELLDRSMVGR